MPRLGPDVPQWSGETIGFWDGEALITWTSNMQGWITHGGSRVQQQAPVDRDLHAAQRRERQAHRHQARGSAVRRGSVRRACSHRPELDKLGDLNENDPFVIMECIPQIFPVNGDTTPMSPGTTFEYTFLDIFGRPWAQIWERYHEKGMERPEGEDIFSFPGGTERWLRVRGRARRDHLLARRIRNEQSSDRVRRRAARGLAPRGAGAPNGSEPGAPHRCRRAQLPGHFPRHRAQRSNRAAARAV